MKAPPVIPRYADLAARILARYPAEPVGSDAVTPPPIALPDRAATVRAIQRALHSRVRRRAMFWSSVGLTAAAAGVLLFALGRGFHAPSSGEVAMTPPSGLTIAALEGSDGSIEVMGAETSASVNAPLMPGAIVRAPRSGHVVLALDTGTRIRVAASSRARVVELGALQRFDLERGSLEAAVAKLQPGHRFVVATPDAEVEVKGTRFELSVDGAAPCQPGVRTRLVVQEGVVAVRHGGTEVRVAAGSAWPACPPAVVEAPAVAEQSSPAPHAIRAHHKRGTRRHAPAPVAEKSPAGVANDPSTLPEQNDLFAAALAARRRGNREEAIRWLDRLVARHPEGQLVDTARIERRHLIESSP